MNGINLRANVFGCGSLAHIARQTALALHRLGEPVAIQNLRPHLRQSPHVSAATAERLHRLEDVPVDPVSWCHVRLAEPQEEERHLVDGLFDAAPHGHAVWWWPVDSSIFGGTSAATLREHLHGIWTSSGHAKRSWLAAGLPEAFVRVVPHGVDTEIFKPEGPAATLPTRGSFRFLTVADSAFWHRKGLDRLLAAYHAAFTGHDDVCLVLHLRRRPGPDPVGERLACLRAAHPDPPEVLLDLEPRLEIDRLYRACQCYLQPSRAEAFGLGILEAMACGLPPAVTGWGGQLDFCTEETSWRVGYRLVPANPVTPDRGLWAEIDVDELVDVLRSCVNDCAGHQRRRSAGLCTAQEWSWERAARITAREARLLTGQRG